MHVCGSWLLFLVLAPLCCADTTSDKLDEGIDDAEHQYSVFVRMTDQLFANGGDYENFCRDHAQDARGVLRSQTLDILKEKSDRSWDAVKERVEKLTQAGEIENTARFWIVNGFACDASGTACQELAADPSVSFVYVQRGPPDLRQQQLAVVPPKKLTAKQTKLYADMLKELETKEPDFTTDGVEVPWNLEEIQAKAVWEEENVAGEGVVVAVLDGGLIPSPPLTRGLWVNPAKKLNGTGDGDGFVDDMFGYDFELNSPFVLKEPAVFHGSACASLIAGRPIAEKMFVTGVAPRARLMILRGMGYLKAYEYAAEHGADVLSMSYMWVNMELGNYRGLFRTAHEHLAAAGIVAVGGAGNFAKSAPPGKQITLPKDIPCVIAVGGVGQDGTEPGFGSRGPCSWKGVKFYDDHPEGTPLMKPDVSAFNTGFPYWSEPAWANLLQFREIWANEDEDCGLYTGLQGNSFAGPHVAGVVALMFSANPNLNPWEVKEILESTCKDIGAKGRDTTFGAGQVQALEAVRAARKKLK